PASISPRAKLPTQHPAMRTTFAFKLCCTVSSSRYEVRVSQLERGLLRDLASRALKQSFRSRSGCSRAPEQGSYGLWHCRRVARNAQFVKAMESRPLEHGDTLVRQQQAHECLRSDGVCCRNWYRHRIGRIGTAEDLAARIGVAGGLIPFLHRWVA